MRSAITFLVWAICAIRLLFASLARCSTCTWSTSSVNEWDASRNDTTSSLVDLYALVRLCASSFWACARFFLATASTILLFCSWWRVCR